MPTEIIDGVKNPNLRAVAAIKEMSNYVIVSRVTELKLRFPLAEMFSYLVRHFLCQTGNRFQIWRVAMRMSRVFFEILAHLRKERLRGGAMTNIGGR